MPFYTLIHNNKVRNLGNFSNIKEVGKLQIFKTFPHLLDHVKEVKESKPVAPRVPRSSNRWRIIYKDGTFADMISTYTKDSISYYLNLDKESVEKYYIVPKFATHINDCKTKEERELFI